MRRRAVADVVALGFEAMILDALDPHRLERAVAHVQRDLDERHAARRERRQERRAQVQAGGRGGHGSALAREHGLIAIAIVAAIGPLDIGRQRHMADRVHHSIDRRPVFGPQTQLAAAVKPPREDFAVQRRRAVEDDAPPRSEPLPGMHQRFPALTRLAAVDGGPLPPLARAP